MGVRKKTDLPENPTLIVQLEDGTRKALLVKKQDWESPLDKGVAAFNAAPPEPKAKPERVRPNFRRDEELNLEAPTLRFASYDDPEELSELDAAY